MKKFELILKNEKLRQYRLLALLIILVNVIFLIWLAVSNAELRMAAIVTTGVIAASFIIQRYLKRYAAPVAAIFFILLFYIEAGYWQAVGIIAALALLYMISVRPLIVFVDSSHIMYPSFPKKQIEWTDINNLVLKDDLLTIDFKNNKVAQAMVINGENDYVIDEKEFNEFCKMQLGVNGDGD